MKISHIFFSFNQGGAELMLVDIMNEQVKNNDVSLIIINEWYSTKLINMLDERINCYCINRKIGSRNILKILKLNILLRNIFPDVIHCHDLNIIDVLWRVGKIKCATLHNVKSETSYLKKYNHVYAISEAVRNYINDTTGIRAEIIYNGIHPENIANNKTETSTGFRIVQVGRLTKEIKGQHLLIKAVRVLLAKGYKIRLDIIGEGASLKELEELVRNCGIEKYVNFLGRMERKILYQCLHTYDLLVQPSLCEGFGISIIEAMAAKIPVLVSNLPGPMEIIDNGRFGAYFESENIDDLVSKLEFQINNGSIKVDDAYLRVCDCFDIAKSSQKYIESYNNLLK